MQRSGTTFNLFQFPAMKTPLKAIASLSTLCIACSFATQPLAHSREQERAIGHLDGETTKALEILVIDADSKAPVPNATITFFDSIEIALLNEIEVRKEAGISDFPKQPAGVTATTEANGKTSLLCKVDWHKVLLENGRETEYITPRGRLRLECEGYRAQTLEMRSLFPKTTIGTTLPPVKIFLKKGINRPLLPENVTVAKIDLVLPIIMTTLPSSRSAHTSSVMQKATAGSLSANGNTRPR